MSDNAFAGLLIVLVMGAFALVPMLARSWRMLLVLAILTGLVAGGFWAGAIFAGWDKDRMIFAIIAVAMTSGWVVGLGGAIFRLTGQGRGWRIASFPGPEILAASAVLALFLMWWEYFFGVFS